MGIIHQQYSYSFPTNIRFGNNVVNELADFLKSNFLTRPLLVTDKTVQELDFFKEIVKKLTLKRLSPDVFSDIHKNPVKSDVIKGGKFYSENARDSVIGIGGGAAMDVARAIVLRVNHRRDLFDYDDLTGGDKYVTEEVPPFITIPTTAGTGSEVGRSAIISEDETGKKRILFHPKLMAIQVFADPQLTINLPPEITAATGMDALTHNMEAFLAKGFHPMADGIALEGIRLIYGSIAKAVNQPDLGSRSKMMLGSLMGAVAFQKGLGVVHSLAHPLSTLLDIHHGLANAIMLQYGMKFNFDGSETRFDRIGMAMGLQKGNAKEVISGLSSLNRIIGLPDKLNAIGVKHSHIDKLSKLALDDFCHPSNPKAVKLDDFKALYEEAI